MIRLFDLPSSVFVCAGKDFMGIYRYSIGGKVILAKQRARRTCLHVHLATAAGANTPPLVANLLKLAAGYLT